MGVGIVNLCGGAQTCAKCKVRIEEGRFDKESIVSSQEHTSPPSERAQKYMARHEFSSNDRFACEAQILGDLVVFVPDTNRINKQIIRKFTTERVITLNPAIRLYYVKIPEDELEDESRGDLERIIDQLQQRFNLEQLKVDYQVLPDLQRVLREGELGVTVTVRQEREIARIARWVHHVQIPMVGEFQDRFIEALNPPHAVDSFPHVDAWLKGERELS